MKHQVDHQGNITLSPTPREIDLIAKSLISKNLQLRLDRASAGTCNELIELMAGINEAMVLSHKAVLLTKTIEEEEPVIIRVPESVVNNDMLFDHLDKILNPSWTTAEFEAATTKTRNEVSHHITSMKFADNTSNRPIRVTGIVQNSGHLYRATWDSWGRCICEDLPKEFWSDYDLVRPGKKKSDSMKLIVYSFLATLLGLFLYWVYLTIQ